MSDATSHDHHHRVATTDDVELLITRLIDGEADESDRRRFSTLANQSPSLWRDLAMRQQDMLALTRQVSAAVDQVIPDCVDARTAPSRTASDATDLSDQHHREPYRQSSPALWLGWAAAFVLAAGWLVMLLQQSPPPPDPDSSVRPVIGSDRVSGRLAPEQHLRRYLQSPFVVGELDPIMLQLHEADDGTLDLRIIRRIEEAYRLESDAPIVDHDGRLIIDPAALQERAVPPSDRD